MTTTMGLLSALTTGWWGQFGDRHGRTRVITCAVLGLLFTYVICRFIFPVGMLTRPKQRSHVHHSIQPARATPREGTSTTDIGASG